MRISTMVNAVVILLLLFAVVSGVSIFVQIYNISHDGAVIKEAGLLRSRVERLVLLEILDQHQKADEIITKIDRSITGLINGDEPAGLLKTSHETLLGTLREIDTAWKGLKQAAIGSRTNDALHKELLGFDEKIYTLTKTFINAAETITSQKINSLKTVQTVLFVLNLVLLSAIWVGARKKVIGPMKLLIGIVDKIVSKNLNVQVEYESKDSVGRLVNDMNKMIDFFNEVLNGTMQSINNVVNTMDMVKKKSSHSMSLVNNQNEQAVGIATATEQMSQTIADIARNAQVASDTSKKALDMAQTGKQMADGAIDSANNVYQSNEALSAMIAKLNHSTKEIGDIATVINDIADQTNLLALNAAIEAARAGEQGRGFAVVADEVRKLAEKTLKATTEISEKIKAVQEESDRTAYSMQHTSTEVTKVTDLIRQMGHSLHQIVEAVDESKDQVAHIATAVEEQAQTSEEVVRNVEKSTQNSMSMEDLSKDIIKEVNGMIASAEELRAYTSGFKTKGGELLLLDLARTDHRLWVNKVSYHIQGGEKLNPEKLADHTMCRLGKWYYSDGMKCCQAINAFQAIETPHKKLHALGKEIVHVYDKGERNKALAMFAELEALSVEIIGNIERLKETLSGHKSHALLAR